MLARANVKLGRHAESLELLEQIQTDFASYIETGSVQQKHTDPKKKDIYFCSVSPRPVPPTPPRSSRSRCVVYVAWSFLGSSFFNESC